MHPAFDPPSKRSFPCYIQSNGNIRTLFLLNGWAVPSHGKRLSRQNVGGLPRFLCLANQFPPMGITVKCKPLSVTEDA